MKPIVKQFSIFIFILLICSLLTTGCLGDAEQLPFSSGDTYAALLVPDTNLELYIYAKQDRPTIVPAEIVSLSHDIKVDSLGFRHMAVYTKLILCFCYGNK